MLSMTDVRRQAVTGLVPPQQSEAVIREVWPSVAAVPPAAGLGRILMTSRIGAPVGWLLLAPLYFKKILPFLATRYWLTNRRVAVMRGLKPKAAAEAALADIDEVRVITDANSDFYRAANLEIVSKGKVVLTLKGVPGPESFRHAIVNAVKAWVPGKAAAPILPAKAEGKK
jgi:hypothetical protein